MKDAAMFHRIGIFGGTFNPIHQGHIAMARAAYEQLSLEKVIFMPAKNPPHKTGAVITDEKLRCTMCELAIKHYSYFECSRFELEREGLSYSAVTLTLLNERFKEQYHGEYEIYFIIGADSFYNLEKWYQPQTVLEQCVLTVAPRSDERSEKISLLAHKKHLCSRYNANIRLLDCPLVDISSSMIRQSFHENRPLKEFLDQSVYDFIVKNGLYQ